MTEREQLVAECVRIDAEGRLVDLAAAVDRATRARLDDECRRGDAERHRLNNERHRNADEYHRARTALDEYDRTHKETP